MNHPGRRITEFEVCKLFRGAYERAATMRNAASGFRAAGIVPYDCNVFNESDFAPSLTTEIEMEESTAVGQDLHNTDILSTEIQMEKGTAVGQDLHSTDAITISNATQTDDSNRSSDGGLNAMLFSEVTNIESCHSAANKADAFLTGVEENAVICSTKDPAVQSNVEQRGENDVKISFTELSPLPNAKLYQRKRKGKQSEVITSSPFKEFVTNKLHKSAKRTAKQSKVCKSRKQTRKRLSMKQHVNEKYFCLICNSPYQEPLTEDWIECSSCKKWCHDKCTDYPGQGLFI